MNDQIAQDAGQVCASISNDLLSSLPETEERIMVVGCLANGIGVARRLCEALKTLNLCFVESEVTTSKASNSFEFLLKSLPAFEPKILVKRKKPHHCFIPPPAGRQRWKRR